MGSMVYQFGRAGAGTAAQMWSDSLKISSRKIIRNGKGPEREIVQKLVAR